MLTSDGIAVVGVVGAGTMGRGIVQLFVAAGFEVRCLDTSPGAAQGAIDGVAAMLRSLVVKGRMEGDAAERACAAMRACETIDGMAECDLVVEAIVEDMASKRTLFAALELVVGEGAILATNTSSLMVSEIAAGCAHPDRVAGLHFFNPVPLMRVVEVIPGLRTAKNVTERLVRVVAATGHRAVIAADQPGFLVNHAGRGLYTEGLRIVEEQVCDVADVDRILREAAGFRMGPFELLDLTGLDVSGKVMASIYDQFHQEPRFRPSSLVPPRIAASLFGRKSGEGWYRYDAGKRIDTPRMAVPAMAGGTQVWIDPTGDDATALCKIVVAAGAALSDDAAGDCLCVLQPWGIDATTAALDAGLDPDRCVAVDPLPGPAHHRTLMLTATTAARVRDAAHAIFAADGVSVTVINDSPGFVTQRVLAVIVNIAANIAQCGIASVEDLEHAVRLGLGYPRGPLAWGDEIGPAKLLATLQGLERVTGDPRYRPSPWLVRRAGLGRSLKTSEPARHG